MRKRETRRSKQAVKRLAPATEVITTPEDAPAAVQELSRAETLAEVRSLICQTTGMAGELTAERLLAQLARMPVIGAANGDDGESLRAAVEIMIELRPANALEAMLTVQMVGVHEGAALFLKNAMLDHQRPKGVDANVLRATRLMRLFNEQLVAMARLKGKTGQQRVTVEHVHVHSGGQAIVGTVTAGTTPPGEGSRE